MTQLMGQRSKQTKLTHDELRRAAESGSPAAQRHLGYMYFSGIGVPKDYEKALKWYRLAAEQGARNIISA